MKYSSYTLNYLNSSVSAFNKMGFLKLAVFVAGMIFYSGSLSGQAPKLDSLLRWNPMGQNLHDTVSKVTFRSIFSKAVQNVDSDDFSLSGSLGSSTHIDTVLRINDSTYEVRVDQLNGLVGDLNLDLKGLDGSGSNNIFGKENLDAHLVTAGTNFVNAPLLGQSFIAESSGLLSRVNVWAQRYSTYADTFTVKILDGAGVQGTVLAKETVQYISGPANTRIEITFSNPPAITVNQAYTIVLTGGTPAFRFTARFSLQNANQYTAGGSYFPNFNNSYDMIFETYISSPLDSVLPSIDQSYILSKSRQLCYGEIPPVFNNVDSASGGSGSYTYLWQFSSDGGVSWLAAPGDNDSIAYVPVQPLYDTTFFRRIVIDPSCGDTAISNSMNVQVSTELQLSASITPASCGGSADGAIDATVSGGAPPYTYTWSNGASSEDIDDLIPGSYTLTITDNRGCTEDTVFEVETDPLLVNAKESLELSFPTDSNQQVSLDPVLANLNSGPSCVMDTLYMEPASVSRNEVLAGTNHYALSLGSAEHMNLSSTVGRAQLYANSFTWAGWFKINSFVSDKGLIKFGSDYNDWSLYFDGAAPNKPAFTVSGDYTNRLTASTSLQQGQYYHLAVTYDYGVAKIYVNGVLEGSNSQTLENNFSFGTIGSGFGVDIDDFAIWDRALSANEISSLQNNSANSLTPLMVTSFEKSNGNTIVDDQGNYNGSFYPSNSEPTYIAADQNIPSSYYAELKGVDISGNIGSDKILIYEKPPCPEISILSHITADNCDGNQGIIEVTPIGGKAPYIYNWSNGSTTRNISALSSGDYILQLTDANGCTAADTFNVPLDNSLRVSGYHDRNIGFPSADSSKYVALDVNELDSASGPQCSLDSLFVVPDSISQREFFTNKNKYALSLASSEYLDLGEEISTILYDTGELTWAGWFKINSSVGGKALIQVGHETEDWSLYIDPSTGRLSFNVSGISSRSLSPIAKPTIGKYHHIAVSYADNYVTVFVDGKAKVGGGIQTLEDNAGKTMLIGSGIPMEVDDLAIWPRKLSSGEVASLISTPAIDLNPLTTFSFENRKNGSVVADDKGRYNATFSGGDAYNSYTASDQNIPSKYYVYLTGTDTQGNESVDPVILNPCPVEVVARLDNHASYGNSADGSLTAIVTGGVPPYTYQWSNGVTTANNPNLNPGIYEISITDSLGCTTAAYGRIYPVGAVPTDSLQDLMLCNPNRSESLDFSLFTPEGGPVTVSVNSSDQNILPDSAITLTGSYPDYLLEINHTGTQYGNVTITIVTDDGVNVRNNRFELNISPATSPGRIRLNP